MKNFGLIGKSLSHSLSKQWWEQHFQAAGINNASYSLWEMDSLNHLRQWAAQSACDGFNVTIPYKQAILPLLDNLDPDASAIGAVNCVTVNHNGDGSLSLLGHNTDWKAFLLTLQPYLLPHHSHALILGTGGAAQAVHYALQKLNIATTFVSRNPDKLPSAISFGQAYSAAQQCHLIVNATPLGMFPLLSETPWIDLHNIGMNHLCYDLIYNPEETRWLLECELAGATVVGGLDMLKKQAELSWQLFELGPLPPLS